MKVLFIKLYNVVLTFASVDEILKHGYSNESCRRYLNMVPSLLTIFFFFSEVNITKKNAKFVLLQALRVNLPLDEDVDISMAAALKLNMSDTSVVRHFKALKSNSSWIILKHFIIITVIL